MITPAKRSTAAALGVAALALLLAACGGQTPSGDATSADGGATPTDGTTTSESAAGGDISGTIAIDGSSTVGPLTSAAATMFRDVQPGVNVTVAISGTGGGFKTFCAGETDISNASRPIKDEEAQACADAGIEFTELVIANDGLSVVVNPGNDWAECLTTDQLKTIWAPEAEGTVTSWNQVDPSFPDVPLALYGAGTDSGTFDFFTGAINGEEGATRADYTPSEDDNVTVQGVAGSEGGLGYFGLSYAEENADAVKLVAVDSGDGCILPSKETVQDGTYTPLGRPLFIYINNADFADNPALRPFVEFYLDNEETIAEQALFIDLTDDQVAAAHAELATLEG